MGPFTGTGVPSLLRRWTLTAVTGVRSYLVLFPNERGNEHRDYRMCRIQGIPVWFNTAGLHRHSSQGMVVAISSLPYKRTLNQPTSQPTNNPPLPKKPNPSHKIEGRCIWSILHLILEKREYKENYNVKFSCMYFFHVKSSQINLSKIARTMVKKIILQAFIIASSAHIVN